MHCVISGHDIAPASGQAQAGSQPGAGNAPGGKDDSVVDAEFEEVKDGKDGRTD